MAQWIIDPDHTVAAFTIRHLMMARVHGQFNTVSGMVAYDPEEPAGLDLELKIDAAGIYTGIAKRDEHLRSPDFFDVLKSPIITFRSTAYEIGVVGKGRLAGQLVMHGFTRPIILDVTIAGPLTSPADIGGETTIGISATAKVNREGFGMKWNVPLGDDMIMVDREVKINLEIEADLVA